MRALYLPTLGLILALAAPGISAAGMTAASAPSAESARSAVNEATLRDKHAAYADAHPTQADAWFRLGVSEAALDNHVEAIRALQKAYVRAPNDFETTKALGYAWLGWAVSDQIPSEKAPRALTAASKNFELALRLNPDDFDSHRMLGKVNLVLGRYPAARTAFEAASRIQPEDADVRQLLAEATRKAGPATP
jgi:cytochrome c-type biogenesis protein CcmH/NrfG